MTTGYYEHCGTSNDTEPYKHNGLFSNNTLHEIIEFSSTKRENLLCNQYAFSYIVRRLIILQMQQERFHSMPHNNRHRVYALFNSMHIIIIIKVWRWNVGVVFLFPKDNPFSTIDSIFIIFHSHSMLNQIFDDQFPIRSFSWRQCHV